MYSWDDASAPQLSTSNDGSLYNVLKAVLLTGYGSRTPVGGWTSAFDNGTNTIVIQHATESIFYRLQDDLGFNYAEHRFFTAMSGINTGTGDVPPLTQQTTWRCGKRSTTSSGIGGSDQWRMFVDSNGDWFHFVTLSSNSPTGLFFGKLDYPVTAERRWMITGLDDSFGITTADNADMYVDINNSTTPFYYWPNAFKSGPSDGCLQLGEVQSYRQPSPIDGRIYIRPQEIYGITPEIFLGYLPARFVTQGKITDIANINQRLTIDGRTFVYLPVNGATINVDYLYEYNVDS